MRDDMVIRPRLKQPAQPSTRAIDDRKARAQARTKERQSVLARLARVRLAARAAVAMRARQASSLVDDAFSLANPAKKLTAAALAIGVGALIAKKLDTGKSFRLLADEYVEEAFGDLDEQAAAAAEARASIPSQWFGIIDRSGGRVPEDIARVYQTFYGRSLSRRLGETRVRLKPEFDSQGTLDNIVTIGASGIRKAGSYLRSLLTSEGSAK